MRFDPASLPRDLQRSLRFEAASGRTADLPPYFGSTAWTGSLFKGASALSMEPFSAFVRPLQVNLRFGNKRAGTGWSRATADGRVPVSSRRELPAA